MRPDYQVDRTVRQARWWGWLITALIGVTIVLALAWKIAVVSEQRALEATREHLAASLSQLVAEQTAKNQRLDESWRTRNPFALLRWQQDNYCGELAAGDTAQPGCWYWLPGKAWLLYRPRFGDDWTTTWGEVRVYRLLAVPGALSARPQSAGRGFALELQAVTQAEQSAAGFFSTEGRQ